MTVYRDNYPNNIEAPQRVNFQYSHDIVFDYSTGKYPLGETHEGFLWEEQYIPVEHYVGDDLVGKHVWMRVAVGVNSDWTYPIRLTDSFTNIEVVDVTYDTIGNTVTYSIKYTMSDGSIIQSEPIIIQNGVDGVSIVNSAIVGNNLILTYSNGTVVNVGRVVGYDGTGVPIGSPDGYHLVSRGDVPAWEDFNTLLNTELSANAPLDFTASLLTHIDTDGNKHVPAGSGGGIAGYSLVTTDGAGSYDWVSHLLTTALDDTAIAGATDKLYSADKILSLITSASFGIKYSVDTIIERDAIVGMSVGDLCVVNGEPNRPVFQWSGAVWNAFFDLDADHNHDDRYYTKVQLYTAALGAQVHWLNLTSVPSLMQNFTVDGDAGSVLMADGDTLSIVGGTGVSTAIAGNTLTIDAVGTTYTAGAGLDLNNAEFSHADTSPIISPTTNLGGTVIQNLEFDEFGHVQNTIPINLDGRYSLIHTHYALTNGNGIASLSYNTSSAETISVDFGGNGSANTVSRSDHTPVSYTHLTLPTIYSV